MTTTTKNIRILVLVADASRQLCEAAEEYLTENEGDDLSISVRPCEGDKVEGLFELKNGRQFPAALQHDEDAGLEDRVNKLIHSAWEHAHDVESQGHWYEDDEREMAEMDFC